jgi:hypothetical protein
MSLGRTLFSAGRYEGGSAARTALETDRVALDAASPGFLAAHNRSPKLVSPACAPSSLEAELQH